MSDLGPTGTPRCNTEGNAGDEHVATVGSQFRRSSPTGGAASATSATARGIDANDPAKTPLVCAMGDDSPGEAPARRMTRARSEYDNTVRDLGDTSGPFSPADEVLASSTTRQTPWS
jgi:hypothetical protein